MDIYRIIENDHALTRMLLDRVAAARNPEWRYLLCRDLAAAVQVHARAKRTAFYDLLARNPHAEARIASLQEEQDIAQSFLREALSHDPDNAHFMRLYREARAELEHLMQAEVESLFPYARSLLDDLQAERAGQQMRALKDELIEAEYMGSASLRADAGYYS